MDSSGGIDELLDALLLALADSEPSARGAAAATLGRLHPGWRQDAALAQRGVGALLSPEAPFSEKHTGEVLGALAPLALDDVKRAALGDSNAVARRLALRALTSLGAALATDTALAGLRDSDPEVRWVAAAWLAGQANPESLSVLLDSLSDAKRQAEAARMLGRLRNPAAIGPLVDSWAKGNTAAAQALADLDAAWRATANADLAVGALVAAWAGTPPATTEAVQISFEEIEPGWTLRPEARVALPWLTERWIAGDDAAAALLDRIDPLWRRLPETRRLLPKLATTWATSVVFSPPPRDRYHYGRPTAEEEAATRAKERSQLEGRLTAIDEAWQRSPEVKEILPSLIQMWGKRWSSQAPLAGEAELRALLSAADPRWHSRPQVLEYRRALTNAWASGHNVASLLDEIDPDWRHHAADFESRAAATWLGGHAAMAADLDVIAPTWRQGQIDRIWEQYSSDRYRSAAGPAKQLQLFDGLATKTLTTRLGELDEVVRLRAAELLIVLKPLDAIDSLCGLLSEPEFAGRKQALRVLGEIGDARAVDALAQAVQGQGPHQQLAVEELTKTLKRTLPNASRARLARVDGVAPLVVAQADGNAVTAPWNELATALIATLARLGDGQALGTLGLMAGSKAPDLRQAALDAMIEVAKRIKTSDLPVVERSVALNTAVPAMMEIASDPDGALRAGAVRLLATVVEGESASPLAHGLLILLGRDADATVRAGAEVVLRNAAAPDKAAVFQSCRQLLIRNTSDRQAHLRIAAVEAIAFLTRDTPAPTGHAESLFRDLIALGRRDEAVGALFEGILRELERVGEYRRCIELLAIACPEHEVIDTDTAASLSVLNALACYHWALGNDQQALALMKRMGADFDDEPPDNEAMPLPEVPVAAVPSGISIKPRFDLEDEELFASSSESSYSPIEED